MITLKAPLTETIQRTHNVRSFRFGLEKDVEFKAGQFMFVSLKTGEKDETKCFSISNAPTEKGYVEFTKKITASPFSQALTQLKAGDPVTVKLPGGTFVLDREYKKIAFLSGGIGITPIRSICKFMIDRKISTNAILLYGNHTQGDIVFKDDFDAWTKNNANMRVVYTIDTPETGWEGMTGLITPRMIKEEIKDYLDRTFFICGPPAMVSCLTELLNNLQVKEDRIKKENFPGY